MQTQVAGTYLQDSVIDYIVALIHATRNHPDLSRGASPRGTLAMTAMAKAVAQLRGRDYVLPKDVQEVFLHTIAHRVLLSPGAEAQGRTTAQVLTGILETVPAPRLR